MESKNKELNDRLLKWIKDREMENPNLAAPPAVPQGTEGEPITGTDDDAENTGAAGMAVVYELSRGRGASPAEAMRRALRETAGAPDCVLMTLAESDALHARVERAEAERDELRAAVTEMAPAPSPDPQGDEGQTTFANYNGGICVLGQNGETVDVNRCDDVVSIELEDGDSLCEAHLEPDMARVVGRALIDVADQIGPIAAASPPSPEPGEGSGALSGDERKFSIKKKVD